MSEQIKDREILSPEGVEELIKSETTFRITLTGGGKYRIYHISDGDIHPITAVDTLEKAYKECGRGMLIQGGLAIDAKLTTQFFIDKLKGL